jgi:hypothetical protein
VEPAGSKAVPDRFWAKTELDQLRMGNDAMLRANERPNSLMID